MDMVVLLIVLIKADSLNMNLRFPLEAAKNCAADCEVNPKV
jgi:hypothetical protein